MITYPYFYLGFCFDLMDPPTLENFGTSLKDSSLFRRFTYEEAIQPANPDMIKAVQLICGTPIESNSQLGVYATACDYKPIPLSLFIQNNGILPSGANLYNRIGTKVYMNGEVAKEGEDYSLDLKASRIKILWEEIKTTDVFSFSIPFNAKEAQDASKNS